MNILVFGANSLIAHECMKKWANLGSTEFTLVGRSMEKLTEVASDLNVRFLASKAKALVIDFNDLAEIEKAIESAGQLDICLIAQGSLTDQTRASADFEYLQREISLNAVSVAVISEMVAAKLASQGNGTLGVIGSVAGDRGRASNYSYGASKALIETYVEGLQQRFAGTQVKVSLIKPGPTATPMTSELKGKMAEAALVAGLIVEGMRKGTRVIYAPNFWKLIMFFVRTIPFAIFKNLKF